MLEPPGSLILRFGARHLLGIEEHNFLPDRSEEAEVVADALMEIDGDVGTSGQLDDELRAGPEEALQESLLHVGDDLLVGSPFRQPGAIGIAKEHLPHGSAEVVAKLP